MSITHCKGDFGIVSNGNEMLSSVDLYKILTSYRIVVFDDMDYLDGLLRDILAFQETFDVKDPDNQPPLTAICFDDISGF